MYVLSLKKNMVDASDCLIIMSIFFIFITIFYIPPPNVVFSTGIDDSPTNTTDTESALSNDSKKDRVN